MFFHPCFPVQSSNNPMLVHVDFNPPLILKLIDVDDLSGLYIIWSVRSSKPIKMMVDVRFCPIRMNAAATTNRCLARDSAWVPENLLHRFHLTALFIHIYLAPSSLHELPRIGSDASIAFTRNMEPLNGRTGLVQLRPAFKDWSASGFASSRQPPHSQGAGCRLQPDVLSRFLLNQIQFSSQPTNLFQKTQSTFRIRTELTVEVYNWFKRTVWSYPAFSSTTNIHQVVKDGNWLDVLCIRRVTWPGCWHPIPELIV